MNVTFYDIKNNKVCCLLKDRDFTGALFQMCNFFDEKQGKIYLDTLILTKPHSRVGRFEIGI